MNLGASIQLRKICTEKVSVEVVRKRKIGFRLLERMRKIIPASEDNMTKKPREQM